MSIKCILSTYMRRHQTRQEWPETLEEGHWTIDRNNLSLNDLMLIWNVEIK